MLQRIICTITCALLLASTASATDTTITDASWWSALNPHEREIAAFAVLDGFGSGYGEGRLSGISAVARPLGEVLGSVVTLTPRQMSDLKRRGAPVIEKVIEDNKMLPKFGRVDIHYYVARITAFYDDHPEAKRATIGDVAQCLSRNSQRTCEEVARLAASER